MKRLRRKYENTMKVDYQTFLGSQHERMPICPPLLFPVDNSPHLPSIYTTTKVQEMTDRRAYKREDLMQVVNYAPSPYSSSEVLRGLIKDWNGSGICLIARQPLDEGQEIIVSSVVVPKSKTAVVRWARDVGQWQLSDWVGGEEVMLSLTGLRSFCSHECKNVNK